MFLNDSSWTSLILVDNQLLGDATHQFILLIDVHNHFKLVMHLLQKICTNARVLEIPGFPLVHFVISKSDFQTAGEPSSASWAVVACASERQVRQYCAESGAVIEGTIHYLGAWRDHSLQILTLSKTKFGDMTQLQSCKHLQTQTVCKVAVPIQVQETWQLHCHKTVSSESELLDFL